MPKVSEVVIDSQNLNPELLEAKLHVLTIMIYHFHLGLERKGEG